MSYRIYFEEKPAQHLLQGHGPTGSPGSVSQQMPASVKRILAPLETLNDSRQKPPRPPQKCAAGTGPEDERVPLTVRYVNQGWGQRGRQAPTP